MATQAQTHETAAPSALGHDLDLGLRMVEGLVRIGEVGSALRLTEELRLEAARSLVGTPVRPIRTARRGTSVIAGVAVALGVGLSAAAFVAPNSPEAPAERAPSVERRTELVPPEDAPLLSPQVDDQPMGRVDRAPAPSRVAGVGEADIAPADDERRRRRLEPPDTSDPLDPSSLPLIIPLPELPLE